MEEATMSEMVDFIGQSLKEAEASGDDQPPPQPDAETEVQAESSEAAEDVNEEVASPPDTDEGVNDESDGEQEIEVEVAQQEPEDKQQKDSKWVPRDRLNEVNDKWRQREQQLLVQIGALEERTKQLNTRPAPKAQGGDDGWLEDFVADGAQTSPDIEQLRETQQKILAWQEANTRQRVYDEFNAELRTAMEKYPEIPEEVFRNAVMRDGTVNMVELGDRLSSERKSLEDRWRSEWEKSNPTPQAKAEEVPQEPQAVRRPSRQPAPPPAPKASKESFSTVREAGDAMAKEMAAFFENL